MLKQSVRAVVLFFFIVSVASVNGQSTHRIKVDVPFQFILNGQTLPAGRYVIERADAARPNIITLKKADGRIVRVILTQRVERDRSTTAASLIFVHREGKHYVFQVWNAGAMSGNQIPFALDTETGDQQRGSFTLVTLKARH